MPNQNIFEHKDLTLTRDFIQKLNALEQGMALGNIVHVVTCHVSDIGSIPVTIQTSSDYQVISEKLQSNIPVIVKLGIGSDGDYTILQYSSCDSTSITFESGLYNCDITGDGFRKCVLKLVFNSQNGNSRRSEGYLTLDAVDETALFKCNITGGSGSYYVSTFASYNDVTDALDDDKIVFFKADFLGDEIIMMPYSETTSDGVCVFSNISIDSVQNVIKLVKLYFPSVGNCYVTVSELYIPDSSAQNIIEKTYSELVSLANNESLIPNQTYVITDFNTTSSAANTLITGTIMRIQVKAATSSTLFPEAKIVYSENDVFGDAIIKWKVMYDLYNDTEKYSWADTSYGKGVIYYLEDEKGNCCDYDFKNIKFLKNSDNNYYFTFSYLTSNSIEEASLKSNSYCNCNNNVIKSKRDSDGSLQLPFIVMSINDEDSLSDKVICDNTFEYCSALSMANPVIGNMLYNCTNVTAGISFKNNIAQGASNATLGIFFENNRILNGFTGAVGNFVKYNRFGERCSVTIGNRYEYCTFENNITGTFTDNGTNVRYIHVMSGFTGTFDGSLYDAVNNPSLWVSRTSTGDTKVYSIADLVK